jgi:response regulator RpfG family c-di-GMP phosphodiesterase
MVMERTQEILGLKEDIEKLFDGFVQASVLAIEARDPSTSGHSSRVAELTVGLAEAVNRTPNGFYGPLHFTDQQIKEIRYASLLHDFGKVGVREQVLVKARKLQPERLERILQRLYQRDMEIALLAMERAWDEGEKVSGARFQELVEERRGESRRLVDLITRCNEPQVLPIEIVEAMDDLEVLEFTHWEGRTERILESDDIAALRIAKGSLSEVEREEVNSHVTHTYRFLSQIPWTGSLAGLPEIAYAHHERLNGKGYPRGLTADQIPPQSRLMAISDVYDALVASDRPYKVAVTVPRSLEILEGEVKSGLLDAEALRIFLDAKIYELTIPRFRS